MNDDYKPQVGDRVRVTCVHEGVLTEYEQNPPMAGWYTVDVPAQSTTIKGRHTESVTIELVERTSPTEEWQPGDVVRNADDPADPRAWVYRESSPPDHPWVPIGPGEGATWRHRDELPAHLRLLVRGGQPVAQPDVLAEADRLGKLYDWTAEERDAALRLAQWQPGPSHPQPGDVVTEEPPVGSIVRDEDGDSWERIPSDGWWCTDPDNGDPIAFATPAASKSFNLVKRAHGRLTLVRWGPA